MWNLQQRGPKYTVQEELEEEVWRVDGGRDTGLTWGLGLIWISCHVCPYTLQSSDQLVKCDV